MKITPKAATVATIMLALGMTSTAAHAAIPLKPEPSKSGTITVAAKRLDAKYVPLRKVANALDAVGRTSASDVYSGLYLNGSKGTVDLWLTDLASGSRVLAEARRQDPRADFRRVRVHKGAFSRKTLNIVRDRLISAQKRHALPYRMYSGSVAYDGSGIQAGVSSAARAQTYEPTRKRALMGAYSSSSRGPASVPVAFFHGRKAGQASYNKWNDLNNQIGGDQLSLDPDTNGGGWCTAGFAADDSSGTNYLITAGHCAVQGDVIRSGGGTAVVGTAVASPNQKYDSIILRGNTSGKYYNDEGEANPTQHYQVLSGGHAYSYNGDVVCQNGVSTAWRQAETPCNITVANSNAFWDPGWPNGTLVQGVVGTRPYDVNHAAVLSGDSGATVFTYNGGNRQLRGIVEAFDPCGTSDGRTGLCTVKGHGYWSVPWPNGGSVTGSDVIGWVEATDILRVWGLTQDTKP